ncbi:C-mannosyltransferase dpy-19 homolog [Culicoides brevitarsis]|uniref:C-mannosyltransferase dpy-19 homolog n=1 Tax=Culicoides brevitarsis TaxID=469753 RepID=UPI00307BAB23
MYESRLVFIISSALIGIGLACIHVFHASNVFEFQTGFSELSKIERFLIFSKDQYFYFYKTIVESKEFDTGLNLVLFDNMTEYPRTINSAHRFFVVPEIFTSLMYLTFMNVTELYDVSSLWCWDDTESVECNGLGDPMYFYLSIIWILSGLLVFTMYMYGTFLSKHIFGGFACVIYYFTLHEHATNIHNHPSSRENFAVPFLLIQFFILSKEIAKRRALPEEPVHRNLTIISDMALITTVSIIFWPVSSVIFSTQIIVMYFLYETGVLQKGLIHDYTFSQISANVFAYALTNKSSYFLTSIHFTMAISLELHILKSSMYTPSPDPSRISRIRRFIRNLALLVFFAYITFDIMNKIFSDYQDDNITLSYIRLAAIRFNMFPASISSFLLENSILHGNVRFETLKAMFNVFCVKNICLFIIVFLGKFLQNRREKSYQEETGDIKERVKNYVIEDYMEENRIKMNDLSNPNTEKAIQNCLDLLKNCNYDYLTYKQRKANNLKAEKEKTSFLSDIKKLKDQINEKEKSRQQDNKTSTNASNNVEKQDSESSKESKTNPETQNSSDSNYSEFFSLPDPVFIYNISQLAALGLLQIMVEKLKYIFIPFACVVAVVSPSKKWFLKNTHVFFMIYVVMMICTLINPGFKNIKDQYKFKESQNLEVLKLLKWIDTTTAHDAKFGGPVDVISAVQLITKRPIINHQHIELPEIRKRTKSIYAMYSRRPSVQVHNDLSTMRVDYVIVSHELCFNKTQKGNYLVDFWDKLEPDLKHEPQLCRELFANAFTSFLKVYENKKFIVVRVFSENLSDFSDIKLLPSKYRTTQLY